MELLDAHTCAIGIEESLHIIAGKWKPIILLHLALQGTQRFTALKRRIPGVTQKMLTAQLRELEQEDLIERTVYPEVPPRVEYALTEHGRTIEHILRELNDWGKYHIEYLDERRAQQTNDTV